MGKEKAVSRPKNKEKISAADTSEIVVIKGAANRTGMRQSILPPEDKIASPKIPVVKVSATERKALEEHAAQLQAENAANATENGLSSMENVADQFSTLTMRKINLAKSTRPGAQNIDESEEEASPSQPQEEEIEETMYSSADDEDSFEEI